MFSPNSLKGVFKELVKYYSKDTAFALSSGQGKCGVAVIRVSGPKTGDVLKTITALPDLPKPRYAMLRNIRNVKTGEIIDKGLVLWFPGPKSFTGEDCCEFQVHGSVAVVNEVFKSLSSLEGVRLAEPGEFSKRAFYNGKLDLVEVEGLGDLLQAETEAQRKQAFLQSQGHLSKLYNKWRDSLTKSLAHLESYIDFDETETLDNKILDNISSNIKKLINEIQTHLDDRRKGEILRNGVKTVIIGEPNVGKSSILNLLCKRPAAIVTPIEGTTRDLLEVKLNIGGYPLVLVDTAGLRNDPDDIIEEEGISRALKTYSEADLIILVVDALKYYGWKSADPKRNIYDYVKKYVESLNVTDLINNNGNRDEIFSKPCLVVVNKTDLLNRRENTFLKKIIQMSCTTEEGVQELTEILTQELKIICGEPTTEHPSMNQARHRQNLIDCMTCLESFDRAASEGDLDVVLMAEYVRKAMRSLGKLVGTVTTEQLLDIIFKDFCIGK